MRQRALTKRVLNGLSCWGPVMDILLETPDDSELQEISQSDREDMRRAVEWIDSVVSKKTARWRTDP